MNRPTAVVRAGRIVLCALAVCAVLDYGLAIAQTDPLQKARQLVTAGDRPQAISFLRDYLTTKPGDVDARVLLGVCLSWERRYDEARAELKIVLEANPGYYDAVSALAAMELWSGHADMALSLAGSVLRRNAEDVAVLLVKARALAALGRAAEARDVIELVLVVDIGNTDAQTLKSSLQTDTGYWSVGYGYTADWFSDSRASWREQQVVLKRKASFGSVSFTAWQADRYGLADRQYQLELYPTVRPGTYLYVDLAGSESQVLYPHYRAGTHLYQRLGGGFEASIGMTRLGFSTPVNVYIGSLSKYFGRWLAIGQVFVTPNVLGTNASYHAAVRRYWSDTTYAGLRYHHGAAREQMQTVADIQVLNSNGVTGEVVASLGRHVGLTVRSAWARQQRWFGGDLDRYTTSALIDIRF